MIGYQIIDCHLQNTFFGNKFDIFHVFVKHALYYYHYYYYSIIYSFFPRIQAEEIRQRYFRLPKSVRAQKGSEVTLQCEIKFVTGRVQWHVQVHKRVVQISIRKKKGYEIKIKFTRNFFAISNY